MRRLAIPAAIGFHSTATIIIWIAGKFGPFSQPFPDAVTYQSQIVVLTDVLRNMGLAAWFFALLPLHVKLYSLCFAVFAHWTGFSILLIEPLNALYYAGILYFVYRVYGSLGIDGADEIALHYALNIMSSSGLLFDLEMKIEGAEILREALLKSNGTLIVAPHALLVLSLFRYLHDRGCFPTIVSAAPFVHIYGKRLVTRALPPSSSLFIRLRTVLRRGDVVCAMIDEAPRNSARTIQFPTSTRPIYISDGLIKLARRCDAGVIFTSARLDERQNIVLRFEAPLAVASMSELSIAKSFVNFLETHVERRSRRVST